MEKRYKINSFFEYVTYYTESDLIEMGMEILDVSEGALIDSVICEDRDGNIHIYAEKALNCWSSGLVEICEDMTDSEKWDYWYDNFAVEEV